MSVPVARRQLLHRKGRTLAGVTGIAAALLLILALKAIFAGMEARLATYIDHSGADVVVAQRGVQTMHMTESALPESTSRKLAALPGVERARAILYAPATVERGEKRGLVYLIGDDTGGALITLAAGRRPGPGGIVLDRALAESLGATLGSRVRVLGRSFTVTGEVSGFTLITNSFAFLRRQDLAQLLRAPGVVSYIFVGTRPGTSAEALAERIETAFPGVTASTRRDFARSEQRVVGDMSTDIVRAMILVAFVIGVAVAGLVAYSATLSQLRDYALLRALGLRASRALALAVAQVGAIVTAGFVLALGLVWLLAWVLPALSPVLALAVKPADVAQAFAVAAVVALAAAAFPAFRITRVDPASVFRR